MHTQPSYGYNLDPNQSQDALALTNDPLAITSDLQRVLNYQRYDLDPLSNKEMPLTPALQGPSLLVSMDTLKDLAPATVASEK